MVFLLMAEGKYCSDFELLGSVNSHASSVPRWQTHVSHILVCSPGTVEPPDCWQDYLGLAHPVKTVVK